MMTIGPESDDLNELLSEQQTLETLYHQMLRVALHKLRFKEDAQDVVQEAWVRILAKKSTLRDTSKLIPWAKAIASNLASNANRAQMINAAQDEYKDEQQAQSQSATGIDPEMIAVLQDLLGRLDPQTRTLLLYKFYYGYKDAEIAEALQLPIGTVKAQIHRSKAKLHTQSDEYA